MNNLRKYRSGRSNSCNAHEIENMDAVRAQYPIRGGKRNHVHHASSGFTNRTGRRDDTMRTLSFADAIEDALLQAMDEDKRIIILGEDVHGLRSNLYVRFGGERVIPTPISEAAFTGAAVAAAMGGLKPVVEVMLVDFIGVPMDAYHAGKWSDSRGGVGTCQWSCGQPVVAAMGMGVSTSRACGDGWHIFPG
jgi:hypothetical protein